MKCFSRIFWDVPKYQKAVRSLVSPDMSCPYSLLSMLSFEKAILEIGYYGNLSFNSQVQVPRTFLYLVTLWFVKVQGVGGRVRVSWQNGFRGGEGTNNHNYFNCQVSQVYFWQNKKSLLCVHTSELSEAGRTLVEWLKVIEKKWWMVLGKLWKSNYFSLIWISCLLKNVVNCSVN